MDFPTLIESPGDLSEDHIATLLARAQEFRDQTPPPPISRKAVATLFLEPSTRTKLSFALAAQSLGHFYLDLDGNNSSLQKGESLEETLANLSWQGIELCIVRTPISRQLSSLEISSIKLINGGDGNNHHPTQALVDLLTIKDLVLENPTIAIVGDIRHSRVAHSLLELLPRFDINLILCSPEAYLPDSVNASHCSITTDLQEALERADILYLLRIQKERHQEEAKIKDYREKYGITKEKLNSLSNRPLIMHPGPANLGIEIDKDVWLSDCFIGDRQVKNSIPLRMSLIEHMLGMQYE